MNTNYKKYLKYKNKYLQLKNQLGGDYNRVDYAAYIRPDVHSDPLPPASRRNFVDISLNDLVKLVDQEAGVMYQTYKYKGLIGGMETFALVDGNEDTPSAYNLRQSSLANILKYNEPIENDGAFFNDYDQTKWVGCYRYNTINYPDIVLIDINKIVFVPYNNNPQDPRALSLKNEYKYRMLPPIDVSKIDETNYKIRNGNHRLAYSIGMGYTHMPCRIH